MMARIRANNICWKIYINVTRPQDPGWLIGRTWGIKTWEDRINRGSLFQIKKEPAPLDPLPVGPNPVLARQPEVILETSTTIVSSNPTEESNSTPVDLASTKQGTKLWNLMEASFKALNFTNPNLTQHCWLCYVIRPPYYEALGVTSKPQGIKRRNHRECTCGGGKEGITREYVTGKGRFIGKVPKDRAHLCGALTRIKGCKSPADWWVAAKNTKWICSVTALTPSSPSITLMKLKNIVYRSQ